MVKASYKKILAGLAAGTIIATGSAMLLDTADAASQRRPVVVQETGWSLNDMARHLAADCNVNASDIVSYCNNGGYFHDACDAAHIARLSGKTFDEVIGLKTNANNWQQVAEQLGITQAEWQNERMSMMAARIAADSNSNSAAIMQLLQEGYNSRDIEIAARIAAASGKDVHSVMEMKKVNNRWSDVARELGVDEAAVRPQRPGHGYRGDCYRHHGHNRPHHGQSWIDPDEELDPGFGYPPKNSSNK